MEGRENQQQHKHNTENLEKINQQIKDNFQKAFINVLKEKVASEPPDYDWITRLYTEIHDKLVKLLRPTSALRKEINEHMDIELFDQMIRNKAFNAVDFYKLICYVFDLIKKLGSPARDNYTDEKKNEVLDIMKNNGTFADIVPIFIINANVTIDFIYEDITAFKKKFTNNNNNNNNINNNNEVK